MLPKNKKLKRVRPFNTFFFRSCYYHQLLAGYAHYGVDSLALIKNAEYIYRWDEKRKMLVPGFLDFLTDEELEEYTGVRLMKKTRSEDIVEEVRRSVARGYPTLLAVDCFYLTYREDTFEKLHAPHYLLAYGYTEGQEFIVNEHMYTNSMFYLERAVPFEVTARAYAGIAKDFAQKAKPAVIKMKRVGENRTDCIDWAAVRLKKQKELQASSDVHRRYMTYVRQLLESGKATPEDAIRIVDSLNELQWGMSSAQYNLSYQDSPPALVADVAQLMENYKFLIGTLYRYHITGVLKPQSAEKAVKLCGEAMRLERKIQESMRGETV